MAKKKGIKGPKVPKAYNSFATAAEADSAFYKQGQNDGDKLYYGPNVVIPGTKLKGVNYGDYGYQLEAIDPTMKPKDFLKDVLAEGGKRKLSKKEFNSVLRNFRERNVLKKGEYLPDRAIVNYRDIDPYLKNSSKLYQSVGPGGVRKAVIGQDDIGSIAMPGAKSSEKQGAGGAGSAMTDAERAMADPTTQWFLNEALGGFRNETAQLKEQLANLYTGTYGETGALKQFDTQSLTDQRRLAAEMASRGTLQSGAYAGGERGLGTQQQKVQAAQRADIEQGYTSQTSPQYLFDRGMARNPDGSVRELVEGETVTWTDPATGETKSMKYSWTNTSFGREAKQAALQQWMQKQLSGVTSVI